MLLAVALDKQSITYEEIHAVDLLDPYLGTHGDVSSLKEQTDTGLAA